MGLSCSTYASPHASPHASTDTFLIEDMVSCSFNVDADLATVDYKKMYNGYKKSTISNYFKNKPNIADIMTYKTSALLDENIDSAYGNGFFSAIMMAYSYHIPLTLRPDNFWFQIMQEIARHINKNSEKFRSHITDSCEKTEVFVEIEPTQSFDDTIELLVDKLKMLVKDKSITNLCTKPFTTTTPLIQSCYGSVLMNAMQSYFSYGVGMTCGIKHVKLEGKLIDWTDLLERIKLLKTMPYAEGIEKNLDMMIINIEKIIASYRGVVDKEFWNSIVNQKSRGSGSPLCSGWILDFFIYDVNDNMFDDRINDVRYLALDDIPPGYSGTEFTFNGRQKMMFYSGQSGVQILSDKSITPSFINVVAIKNQS